MSPSSHVLVLCPHHVSVPVTCQSSKASAAQAVGRCMIRSEYDRRRRVWPNVPHPVDGTLCQEAPVVGDSERVQAPRRIRLRLADVVRLVAVWLVSSAALALADALLPNLKAKAPWTRHGGCRPPWVGLPAGACPGSRSDRLARSHSCRSGGAGAAGLRRDLDRSWNQRHVLVSVLGVVDCRICGHRRCLVGKCRD